MCIFTLLEVYLQGQLLEVGLLGQMRNTYAFLLDVIFPGIGIVKRTFLKARRRKAAIHKRNQTVFLTAIQWSMLVLRLRDLISQRLVLRE